MDDILSRQVLLCELGANLIITLLKQGFSLTLGMVCSCILLVCITLASVLW